MNQLQVCTPPAVVLYYALRVSTKSSALCQSQTAYQNIHITKQKVMMLFQRLLHHFSWSTRADSQNSMDQRGTIGELELLQIYGT